MKKSALLLFAMIIIIVSCKKDDTTDDSQTVVLTPKQVQFGLAINYTATWCGPCGDWGAPLIHELSNMGDVVAITVHASGDPMYIPNLYYSFSSDRPTGGGIPAFWVGDTKTTNTGAMTALLGQTPIAGVAMSSVNSGTSMTVKTKVEFFELGIGEYYLAVLILEDGIDGSSSAGQYEQNGVLDPSTYHHDFVLRASNAEGSVYGEMIINDPSKGEIFEREYEIALNPDWNNAVYAVTILWEKGESGSPIYKFINTTK